MSLTYTKSSTSTITHARYLSSKVAADMHLCARYYDRPTEEAIRNFAEELAQYINEGYLEKYEFGFQKDNKRVISWQYSVDANGILTTDDRPGKVFWGADVGGAEFFNFLTQNSKFLALPSGDRDKFKAGLPIKRVTGEPPSDGNGYWMTDKNYFSGSNGLGRQTFRPL